MTPMKQTKVHVKWEWFGSENPDDPSGTALFHFLGGPVTLNLPDFKVALDLAKDIELEVKNQCAETARRVVVETEDALHKVKLKWTGGL